MKIKRSRTRLLFAGTLLVAIGNGLSATHYVDINSQDPVAPYTNWSTGAKNIQDAVDAAAGGDTVLVTNGTYSIGGRAVGTNLLLNRLVVDKPVAVRSVNGAADTVIQGYQVPGSLHGSGDAAVRCVYLASGSSLAGFTLTQGGTRTWADGIDWIREVRGGGAWCESSSAIVSNCVFQGNSADIGGGGAYSGTLNNCTFIGNSTDNGGGAEDAVLNNCTLTCNSANQGGGVDASTANNCTVTDNSAWKGGGAFNSTLNNCALRRNSGSNSGGAAFGGALNNCLVSSNAAGYYGGGASGDDDQFGPVVLNNCTLIRNRTSDAAGSGGGVFLGVLNNCIVQLNDANAAANYDAASVLNYCCTTPLPASGTGNLSVDPRLASESHVSADSPCRAAGSSNFASGTDLDGETWATPPSIGCDEYHSGAVTGFLSVAVSAAYTNASANYPVALSASIAGRVTGSVWDFGDGTSATNEPFISHAWTSAGNEAVVLRVFNESQPNGITATVIVQVVEQAIHYVSAQSANPLVPYVSWITAATNIQDAISAATIGSTILVSNGVYNTGVVLGDVNELTNQITVDKPVTLLSVNGPQVTVIDGSRSGRCVHLAAGANLSGFTLTNGFSYSGAGAWCEGPGTVVSNCFLIGNEAFYYGGGIYGGTVTDCLLLNNAQHCRCAMADDGPGQDITGCGGGAYGSKLNRCVLSANVSFKGGGAVYGTLNNCVLTLNSAYYEGGGAADAVLNNCTLVANSALRIGGGAYSVMMNNCIVYYNTAGEDGTNYDDSSSLSYCSTIPQPETGTGNITNAPRFVDQAANLRLQSDSPCINSGNNSSLAEGMDLEGNPRIVGGTVDMGAYEFQTPASVISYAWLQEYGLPTDGSADFGDPDGDKMNNWQEWRCGTDPLNALSVLRLLSVSRIGTSNRVRWQSVLGANYFLEQSTNLAALPPVFRTVATNLSGQAGTTTFTATNALGPGPFFYRVGVAN